MKEHVLVFIATFGFELWPPLHRHASGIVVLRECGQYRILEFNQVTSRSGVIIQGLIMVWVLGFTRSAVLILNSLQLCPSRLSEYLGEVSKTKAFGSSE